ncbi:lariat debranching enzyme [Halyomorpha halys]|uniref:lariat debranching enzyme n=1 Tax=Halyomorpha halys TaxID=286706 RepID=UPI0006D50F33|nr:lariat debranching enzyme [Halyomorpha halys]
MKIAIEGCAHGELEKIYESIELLEQKGNLKIDLLICCGDFQATRNEKDLRTMAVKPKYRQMGTFYKYYVGEKIAPILTIFIGGNHEASNHLQELPYGGWVAPNIYYLGYAGVVNYGGLRIAGISGIYKPYDYCKGHFEKPPYSESTKKSVYHIRNTEIFRLKQIKSPLDICLSHDWPRGVYNYGNVKKLLKAKQFFEEDIKKNTLGSEPCEELLFHLKPRFWFAAHLHCKFSALIPHKGDNGDECTKFLALDKCLPKRKFLQVVDIPHDENEKLELLYDLEWLTILHYTNHLTSVKPHMNPLPAPGCDERWDFTPTEEEKYFILQKMGGNLQIPQNFDASESDVPSLKRGLSINHQTRELCDKLGIDDPMTLFEGYPSPGTVETLDLNDSSCTDDLTFGDSANENSFSLADSEKDESESPQSCGKIALVLPPPKFSDSLNEELEERSESDISRELEEDKSSEQALFVIDESPKRPVEEEVAKTITGPKKFKRRNKDIYWNNDE